MMATSLKKIRKKYYSVTLCEHNGAWFWHAARINFSGKIRSCRGSFII